MALRKYTQQQLDHVVELRRTTGYSAKQIAKITGVSDARIKQYVKELGLAKPSGFQPGNPGFVGNHTEETKSKIRRKHLDSGHRPTKEASDKGRPASIKQRWGSHNRDVVKLYLYTYANAASDRDLEFSLTRADFEELIFQDCHYCGEPPAERKIAKGITLVCNGIDRADNNTGYTKNNSHPACKICNRMKFQWSVTEFIEHCSKVHFHRMNKHG